MLRCRRLLAAGMAALAVTGLAGCGGEDADPGGYGRALEGLCAAGTSAGTDVNAARTTFYDRSHDALHSLARDLEPVDRALAARLLEAKEAVESDLRADPPAASLRPDLDRLREVAGQALTRLSRPVPRCP